MRRKEMVAVFGCFLVSALIGGVMLSSPSVGSPVAMSEAEMVMGGECYELGAVKVWVCFSQNGNAATCSSGGCGCTQVFPLVGKQSGGSRKPAVACASSNVCTTPKEVETSQCGG